MAARKTYRTWLPEHGETEETGVDIEVESYEDAGDAAEARHKHFNRDGDITHDLTVCVRDGSGVSTFESVVEYTINYYSRDRKSVV